MRKTDSPGLRYPGREKPPDLRDAEPHSYVFEEVTPERMRRVDLLAEGGSDSTGAALPDNRGRVYRYLCSECSKVTAVLARHAGHVRYVVDCAHPGCAGEAVQEDGPTARAEGHAASGGEIHAAFFRPLAPDEVAAWAEGVEAEARLLVEELGAGDPDDAEDPTGLAFRDAEATRLINGHLLIEYGRAGG
ncbi:hypothetical protein GBA63_21705 (plasmid) [Rubrobacter tropicus]|uniref:Uncharacterized protein n=1 Tax=Rubrobacter tropicus TaxID=2653851 RepID=A0A6G8QGJ0_9ACTN|nr:hypothetical protein [Rubrobacter tropicus]QIN85337.1 hypothetical protein GBA63_21705 [Rubrobacter tropicus]